MENSESMTHWFVLDGDYQSEEEEYNDVSMHMLEDILMTKC